MSMWKACTVTKAGAQLLIKMKEIEIYAAKYGCETVNEEKLKFQEQVSEPGGLMSVIDIKRYDWGFEIVLRVDNSKITEETAVKQVGFFARIKDSEEEGVLFAIAQDKTGDRVPAYEDMPNFNLEFTIAVAVDTDAEISIVVDPTSTATVGYVEKLIKEIKILINKRPESYAFAERIRNKSKPDYGFTPTGNLTLYIDSADYTGTSEIAVVQEDNSLLDAKNMKKSEKTAGDGDFITSE